MAQIYLSYRREDSAAISGRIYDRLAARFGADAIFKDVDSLGLGEDFRRRVRSAIASSAVQLVIIGPRWLETLDAYGRRRLDHHDDPVRQEIEAALQERIPIIPVLVEHAQMLRADQLPPGLVPLTRFNAVQLRSDPDFNQDMNRLQSEIERLIVSQQEERARREAEELARQRAEHREAMAQASYSASRIALSPLMIALNILIILITIAGIVLSSGLLARGPTVLHYNRQAIAADQVGIAPTPTATLTPAIASVPTTTPVTTPPQTGAPLYQAVNYPTSIRVGSYDTVRLMLSVSQGTLKVIISNVDALQHRVVEAYLPFVADLSAYKDVGFVAETSGGADSPMDWELTTLDRQSFLADRTQSADARYLDQLFFEWRLNAVHEGQNSTAISLKMYLTSLNGTSETTLLIGSPLLLAIKATQGSQATPAGQASPTSDWWPPTWIPATWWLYIVGAIAVVGGLVAAVNFVKNADDAQQYVRKRVAPLIRRRTHKRKGTREMNSDEEM